MVVKKVLGNWLYWIVIDLVSVYLYFNRDLHLTSLLFIVYTIISVFGYFSWINRMKKMDKIIVTGPESSGKTTVCNYISIILNFLNLKNTL